MDEKTLIAFIKSKSSYLATAEKLYNIYNRQLYPYVRERITESLSSEAGIQESLSRACCINILPKIVDKLSNVYTTNVTRSSQVNDDKLKEFVEVVNFNNAMRLANKYLNLHRTVAMEPVFNDKREVSKIRVIPAHKFLVVDDGTIDGNVVAFIKIISHDLVHVYTEQEFFFLNIETGSVSDVVPNTAGRIPVVVLTRDCVTAMPPEDVDTYQMVTLLPLLLTDLNYALKFQCFSIIYTVDVDPSKIILAPNAVWPLQTLDSGMDDKRKPEIGTIKPEVATGDIIDALTTQYNLWLESRNIKLGSIGKGGSVDNLSGIAKAIDNADIESDINYQRELFVQAEKKIFELLSNYSNYDLKGTVTSFEDRPVFSKESKKEKGERLAAEVSAGLTNKREAIKELHPEYDESLIEETVNGMGT